MPLQLRITVYGLEFRTCLGLIPVLCHPMVRCGQADICPEEKLRSLCYSGGSATQNPWESFCTSGFGDTVVLYCPRYVCHLTFYVLATQTSSNVQRQTSQTLSSWKCFSLSSLAFNIEGKVA